MQRLEQQWSDARQLHAGPTAFVTEWRAARAQGVDALASRLTALLVPGPRDNKPAGGGVAGRPGLHDLYCAGRPALLGSGRWLKGFLEAVRFILSGFRLKRSRGDPIHAPGTFTITTLFLLNNKTCLLAQQEEQDRNCNVSGA